ncbi:hypothetical protein [Gilvibacter sp.]|uniref:hypothetical protein n=1 Tax=Gilvibacter sp. TaxID=2729997 RepID=UPI0035BE5F43
MFRLLLTAVALFFSAMTIGQEFQNLEARMTKPFYDKVKSDSITALKFHSSQKAVLIRAEKSYISLNLFNSAMNLIDEQKIKKSQKEVYLGEYIQDQLIIAVTHSFAGRGFSTLYAYVYDVNSKKITGEIEKITNYQERKKDLERRIKILEKSDLYKHEQELKELEQMHTLGKVNFDSVVVIDFVPASTKAATRQLSATR